MAKKSLASPEAVINDRHAQEQKLGVPTYLFMRIESVEEILKYMVAADALATDNNEKCALFTEEYDMTASLMLSLRTYSVRLSKVLEKLKKEYHEKINSTTL